MVVGVGLATTSPQILSSMSSRETVAAGAAAASPAFTVMRRDVSDLVSGAVVALVGARSAQLAYRWRSACSC